MRIETEEFHPLHVARFLTVSRLYLFINFASLAAHKNSGSIESDRFQKRRGFAIKKTARAHSAVLR